MDVSESGPVNYVDRMQKTMVKPIDANNVALHRIGDLQWLSLPDGPFKAYQCVRSINSVCSVQLWEHFVELLHLTENLWFFTSNMIMV